MRAPRTRIVAAVAVGVAAVGTATASPAVAIAAERGAYVALAPTVLFDASVPARATRTFAATGVPVGAAAWLTVSVVAATRTGTATVRTPDGANQPVPTLRFAAGESISNTAIVPTSTQGQLTLVSTATSATHLRVVRQGYFRGGPAARAGMYVPVPPFLAASVKLPPFGRADVPVAGRDGVPADAAAVAVQLSVPTLGKVQRIFAYPRGGTGSAENVAVAAGRSTTSFAVVSVGTLGSLTLENNNDPDSTVDVAVLGYYRSAAASTAGGFVPAAVQPRLFSTYGLRLPYRSIDPGTSETVTIAGAGPLPASGAVAALLTFSGGPGISVFAPGAAATAEPVGSGAAVLVPLMGTGQLTLRNDGTVPADVSGWVEGYVRSDSSLTWSAPSQVAPTNSRAVSCASARFCAIAGDDQVSTTDTRVQTGTRFVGPGDQDDKAVSCGIPTFCIATYGNFDTHAYVWDGSSWTDSSRPPDFDATGVSCAPGTTSCVAVGGAYFPNDEGDYDYGPAVAVTANGSFTQVYGRADRSGGAVAVDCPVREFCMVLGGATGALSNAGGTWTPIDGPHLASAFRRPVSLGCWAAGGCLAVDPYGQYSVWNGSSWSAPGNVSGASTVVSLSCRTLAACFALDADGSVFQYDGAAWREPTRITGFGTAQEISCPRVSFCAAVDDTGKISVGGSG